MASIIPGYNYDIFISYRQKDNKGDRWVSEFVDALKEELESTFKEEISVYFDINPHDGLLETHDVDESLKEKLKCLMFIPIISRTYCDPKSFAWEHEFKSFVEQASQDQFGLKVKLPNGNVASRVLPIQIHDLDNEDIKLCESIIGGVLRGIEFIYKEPGVNKPLTSEDDEKQNLNHTKYRIQINKTANAIKEIFSGLKGESLESGMEKKEVVPTGEKPSPPEKSIIVLPFDNMSPDPDQEYFSDGLTEEIITDLSHIHDLLVISRSSAMTFKGTKSTIKEIADKVNVRYILEGSVRKAGNNLRITAQLIDGITDSHLWAEKYSGTLDDVFDIQEKVSRSIVDALKLKLTLQEKKKITERPINNIAAYECYLKANVEIFKFTEDGLNRGMRYLQNALDIIGDNALLYSGMGFAILNLVNIGVKQEEDLAKSEKIAKKALAIDPEFPKAHAVLGWIALWKNPRQVIHHFKKALSISPDDAFALQGLAIFYVQIVGAIAAAIPVYKRLVQIDPLHFATNWLQGGIHFYNGKYNLALPPWRRLYDLYPENPLIQFYYALTMTYLSQMDQAFLLIDQSVNATPSNAFTKQGLMLKYAILNDKDRVFQEMTSDFQKTCQRDVTFSHHLAGIFALIDAKKEALDWLENAVDSGFINYPLLSKKDPFLKNIRGEKRFKKLMDRVKYEWENFEV